jgi:uncharacterized protein
LVKNWKPNISINSVRILTVNLLFFTFAIMPQILAQKINGTEFVLSKERVIYWPAATTLLLSDLHLGKTGHFRKNGIGIPQTIFAEDMQRFASNISFFKPDRIIIIGDLFHSHHNLELEMFSKWRNDFSTIDFLLVKGNHDILPDEWYRNAGITIYKHIFSEANFSFVHDTADFKVENGFHFSGHIHPGVQLKGLGKQTMRFPCFYFSENHAILPAFSKFTGFVPMKQKKKDTIVAITPTELIRITC